MGLLSSLDFIKRHFPTFYHSLRVNLRHGRVEWTDIQLPPSDDVFSQFSLPFSLSSGAISHLSFHISPSSSSASLKARGIRLALKETSLSNSSFVAFMSELHSLKQQDIQKRTIDEQSDTDGNDSDKDGTWLKLLLKLLPMLLDRIQLDLQDIELKFEFSNNCSIHLSLVSFTTAAQVDIRRTTVHQPDLAKTFVLKQVSMTASTPNSLRKPFQLSFPHTQVRVALINSRYDVDVIFKHDSEHNPLSIDIASLLPFVSSIKRTCSLWRLAVECKRPLHPIGHNRRAWFRYAVRATLRRHRPSRCPALSTQTILKCIRSCIRYHKLYQQYLGTIRNNMDSSGSSTVKQQLDALEYDLDVDIIVILRLSARNRMLASAIITKSEQPPTSARWSVLPNFPFSVFNRSTLSRDAREQNDSDNDDFDADKQELIDEIHTALSTLNHPPDKSAPIPHSIFFSSFPRARVSVQITNFAISVIGLGHTDGKPPSDHLRFVLSNISAHAEFDSDLDSYDLSFNLGHVALLFNDTALLRNGTTNEHAAESSLRPSIPNLNIDNDPFVNIVVNKRASDRNITLVLKVQPASIIVPIDILDQLHEFSKKHIIDLFTSAKLPISPQNEASGSTASSSFNLSYGKAPISITAEFARFDIVIVEMLPNGPASAGHKEHIDSSEGLLIRLYEVEFKSPQSSSSSSTLSSLSQSQLSSSSIGALPIEYRASASLHLVSCNVKLGDSGHLHIFRVNGLMLDSSFSATKIDDHISVITKSITLKLNIHITVQLFKLISRFLELKDRMSSVFSSSSSSFPESNAAAPGHLESNNNGSLSIESKFMHVELYNLPSDNSLLYDRGISATASDVNAKSISNCSSLTIGNVSVKENVYNGKCSIAPLLQAPSNPSSSNSSAKHAISANLTSFSPSNPLLTTSHRLNADFGHIALVAPLQSVSYAHKFITRLTDLVQSLGQENSLHNSSLSDTKSPLPLKSSLNVPEIRLHLSSPHGLSACLKDVSLHGQGPMHDISCDDVCVWYDDGGGDHISRTSDIGSHSEPMSTSHFNIIRKLSHTIESKAVSNDRALSVTVGPNLVNFYLSNFEFSLSPSVWQRLSAVIQSLSNQSLSDQETNDKRNQHASSTSKIMVRGSNLSLKLVEEPSFDNIIRFDIPQSTAIFSTNSEIISLRKLSVLTSTNIFCDINPTKSEKQRTANTLSSVYLSQTHRESVTDRPNNKTHGNNPTSWRVLLRNLDTDVSHHRNCTPLHAFNYSFNFNDSWSLSILSRLVIFVAPSQVQCLTRVIAQFLNQEHPDFQSRDNITNLRKREYSPTPCQPVISPTRIVHTTNDCFEQHSPELKPSSTSSTSPPANDNSQLSTSELSVHCETHVISIELFDEDESGHVSSTVACFDLDPVLFSCKSTSEFTHNSKSVRRTVVTWHGTCPSFRLEDRGVHTPDSKQVVVQTQDSWIGLHGSSSRLLDHDDIEMGLSVEGIIKTIGRCRTSSHQVALKRARVLLSSRLHAALTHFFNRCIVPNNSTDQNQTNRQPPRDMQNSDTSIDDPTAKLSILLVDPIVILLSNGDDLGDSMFQVRADSIKGSLLFSTTGQLLPGSVIKIRNGHLYLLWKPVQPDCRNEDDERSSDGAESINGLLLRRNTIDRFLNVDSDSSQLLSPRHHRPHRTTAGCIDDSEVEPEVKSVFRAKTVTVRLPVGDQRHFAINVPDVNLSTSLLTLKNAIHLSSRLDLGIPDNRNEAAVCPELRIFVGDISAKVGVPTTRSNRFPTDTLFVHQVELALKLACELVVEKNANCISGEVKIAADVHDEIKSVEDHLISPTRVNFELCVIEELSLDIRSEHFVRLTVSPLTVRTMVNIALTLSDDLGLETNRHSKNGGEDLNENEISSSTNYAGTATARGPLGGHANVPNAGSNPQQQSNQHARLNLNVVFAGIIVNCLAEDPRVQILRLVLHDFKLDAVIPFLSACEGALEFSFQDFVVEDTISWSLPWRYQESSNSERWAKLVCGNHEELQTFRDLPFVNEVFRVSAAFRGAAARHLPTPLFRFSRFQENIHSRTRYGQGQGHEDSGFNRPAYGNTNENNAIIPRGSVSGTSPLAKCVLKWISPFDHLAAHLCVKGLDFNIDAGLLSSVIEWARSIGHEFGNINSSDVSSPSSNNDAEKVNNFFKISIDHAVIEPVNIRLCMRAPSRRIQENLRTWILGKLLWNEEELVNGVEIQLPQVVFSGNFYNIDRVLTQIEKLYLDTITSSLFARQLLWQIPRVFKMTRVLGTSLLRRRTDDIFITSVESAALSSSSRRLIKPRRVGLLGILEEPQRYDYENMDYGIIFRTGTVAHHLLLPPPEASSLQAEAIDDLENVNVIDVTSHSSTTRI